MTSYARYPKVPIKPVTLIAQYDDLVDRIFDDVRAVIFPHQAPPGAREVDLSDTDIDVTIDLGVGNDRAAIRTTDLSHDYVEENSAYSS